MKNILGVFLVMVSITSCKTSDVPLGQENILWNLSTDGEIWSSPLLENGKLYFGDDSGSFYCVNSTTGEVQWAYSSKGMIRSRAVIVENGVIFSSDDGAVYRLDKSSGELLWSKDIGNSKRLALPKDGAPYDYDFRQSSPVNEGGEIYVGSSDSNLYKLDSVTGNIIWSIGVDSIIRSTPFIVGDKVFVASWKGIVYSINKDSGKIIWEYKTKGIINSDFATLENMLIIGSRDANLYSFDIDSGEVLWKYRFSDGSWIESSCIVYDDTIYVGSSDSMKVLSLNREGEVNWKFSTGSWAWGTPIIVDDILFIGSLYAPSYSYIRHSRYGLYGIDRISGEEVWRFVPEKKSSGFIKAGIFSTPTYREGILYFGGIDKKFYSVKI